MNLRKREKSGRPKKGDHAKRGRSKPKPPSPPSQSPQELQRRVQELKRVRGMPKRPSPPNHFPEHAKTAHEILNMHPQPSPADAKRVHELLSMYPKLVARARKLQKLGDSDCLELLAQLLPHLHPDAGVEPEKEKELPGLNLPKVLEWLGGRVRLMSLVKRGVEPPTGDARYDPKALCREFEQALEKDNARFEELQRLIALQTEGGAAAEEEDWLLIDEAAKLAGESPHRVRKAATVRKRNPIPVLGADGDPLFLKARDREQSDRRPEKPYRVRVSDVLARAAKENAARKSAIPGQREPERSQAGQRSVEGGHGNPQ